MRPLPVSNVSGLAFLAPIVWRLGVGAVMAAHGWDKLSSGPSGFAGFLDSLGVPAPEFFAYVVTMVELLGGLALIVGLATRFAALAIMLEMVMTIYLVKFDVGLIAPRGGGAGAELDLLVFIGAMSLLVVGPGRYSLDYILGIERETAGIAEIAEGHGTLPA